MSDISPKYWMPGVAIAALVTLYAAYKTLPVQPSAYASQAAPVADPKTERIAGAKADAMRAALAGKTCETKYAYFDCEKERAELDKNVQALDCAMADAASGDAEREKLHRRWQQDMLVQTGTFLYASGKCEAKR